MAGLLGLSAATLLVVALLASACRLYPSAMALVCTVLVTALFAKIGYYRTIPRALDSWWPIVLFTAAWALAYWLLGGRLW